MNSTTKFAKLEASRRTGNGVDVRSVFARIEELTVVLLEVEALRRATVLARELVERESAFAIAGATVLVDGGLLQVVEHFEDHRKLHEKPQSTQLSNAWK